jgi:hypothetical protein
MSFIKNYLKFVSEPSTLCNVDIYLTLLVCKDTPPVRAYPVYHPRVKTAEHPKGLVLMRGGA